MPCVKHPDSGRNRDGRCSRCAAESSLRWRQRHPDKAKARREKTDAQKMNQARIDARSYLKHRDSRVRRQAAWRAAHREAIHQYYVRWYAVNRDRVIAHSVVGNAVRRARTKTITSRLERTIMRAIYDTARRFGEVTGEKYHVDHIIPLSKGGLHHPRNLQVLRGIENLRKGARV